MNFDFEMSTVFIELRERLDCTTHRSVELWNRSRERSMLGHAHMEVANSRNSALRSHSCMPVDTFPAQPIDEVSAVGDTAYYRLDCICIWREGRNPWHDCSSHCFCWMVIRSQIQPTSGGPHPEKQLDLDACWRHRLVGPLRTHIPTHQERFSEVSTGP